MKKLLGLINEISQNPVDGNITTPQTTNRCKIIANCLVYEILIAEM